jgi:hypothetical protein
LIGVSVAAAPCLGPASSALALPRNPNWRECADLYSYYQQDGTALHETKSGNREAVNVARARVLADISTAEWLGCSWAV